MEQSFLMSVEGTEALAKGAIIRTILRILILGMIVLFVIRILDWAEMLANDHANLMLGVLILLFATYVFLMAVPFVPGIEIGIALMVLEGREIVIWVYLATVCGLMLSFMIGHFTRLSFLHKIFADLGMKRACRMIEKLRSVPRKERLSFFKTYMPKFLHPFLIQGRYLAVAVALNIPGNALLGGGGGILLIAGLSRVFKPALMFLTLLLAVAPIPFSILILGLDPVAYFFKD